ncbi:ROK family protein [Anaerosporobacter sp.]|uniref:ROK family protein n=1 Tax=Anaerosporobacter sp. TaxID=1872529 RepID=UPI00286FA240|nr:ROK family protein [Anaerosporobacter sp.]
MKEVNKANIREMLRSMGNATRAELAEHINVSTTTVRSLLCEMQENKEILVIGQDDSSGGRRAERYQLNPERFYGAAFSVNDTLVRYSILNLFGEIAKEGSFSFTPDNLENKMLDVLEKELPADTLRSICIGVPGIVVKDGYRWKNNHGEFEKCVVGKVLREHFCIPVLLENDLNLITIGMGRCHQQMFPQESEEELNIAYIQFDDGCISAGFLSGGRLVRGWNNYSGELGLMPVGGELTLVQKLCSTENIMQYSEIVSTIIKWIILTLNPRYLSLGGPAFRKEAIGIVADILYAEMPSETLPEVLHVDDTWNDYKSGLTSLCVDQMFCSLSLIGEYKG